MMTRVKYVPLEIGNRIPNDLYQSIDNTWKYALKTQKQMRSGSLEKIMPEFGLEDIYESLKNQKNRFV